MRLCGDFVVAGLVVRQGVKDPTKHYNRVLLRELQGTDTLEMGVNEDIYAQVSGYGEFTKVSCVINYNAVYKTFSLESAKPFADAQAAQAGKR